MTLQELLDRIRVMAIETTASPVDPHILRSNVLIEILLPRILDILFEKEIKKDEGLNAFRTDKQLAFVNGVAAMPVEMEEEYIPAMSVRVKIGTREFDFLSYCPDLGEYYREGNSHVGLWAAYSRNIFLRTANAPHSNYTGNATFIGIFRPVIPAIGAEVNISDAMLNQIIPFTAALVNGNIPLSAIALDRSELDDALHEENG